MVVAILGYYLIENAINTIVTVALIISNFYVRKSVGLYIHTNTGIYTAIGSLNWHSHSFKCNSQTHPQNNIKICNIRMRDWIIWVISHGIKWKSRNLVVTSGLSWSAKMFASSRFPILLTNVKSNFLRWFERKYDLSTLELFLTDKGCWGWFIMVSKVVHFVEMYKFAAVMKPFFQRLLRTWQKYF